MGQITDGPLGPPSAVTRLPQAWEESEGIYRCGPIAIKEELVPVQTALGDSLRNKLAAGGIALAATLLLFALLFRGMYDYWEAMMIIAIPVGIALGAIVGMAAGSNHIRQSALPAKGIMIVLALIAYIVVLVMYLSSRV